jgi:hypothetical protein
MKVTSTVTPVQVLVWALILDILILLPLWHGESQGWRFADLRAVSYAGTITWYKASFVWFILWSIATKSLNHGLSCTVVWSWFLFTLSCWFSDPHWLYNSHRFWWGVSLLASPLYMYLWLLWFDEWQAAAWPSLNKNKE